MDNSRDSAPSHGIRFVAACGERDGRDKNQCAAEPGVWAELFAEQLDAQDRSHRRLDVEEDAGTRRPARGECPNSKAASSSPCRGVH